VLAATQAALLAANMQDSLAAVGVDLLGLNDHESTVMTNDGSVNRHESTAVQQADDDHDDTYHDEQAEADIAAAAAAAAAGDIGSIAAAGSNSGSSGTGWVPRLLDASLPKHPASKAFSGCTRRGGGAGSNLAIGLGGGGA
jgi:hypothetical protein